jgi:hypothetical protein
MAVGTHLIDLHKITVQLTGQNPGLELLGRLVEFGSPALKLHRQPQVLIIVTRRRENYLNARYGAKSSQICWTTFGSSTRVSPLSRSLSE